MKIGIMQPYFLPYIGYWQLISYVDQWVVFDVTQYMKKSWMNRNRILHPDASKPFNYITVPVSKHDRGSLINEIEIQRDNSWKARLLGQLSVYRKLHAQHYRETMDLVHAILEPEFTLLRDLVTHSLETVAAYLNMDFSYRYASEINFERSEIQGPGDWALSIARHFDADEYVNPPGGHAIFDEKKYIESGIALNFLKPRLSVYPQSRRNEFIPALSIVDQLMFLGADGTRSMITTDFEILDKKAIESLVTDE